MATHELAQLFLLAQNPHRRDECAIGRHLPSRCCWKYWPRLLYKYDVHCGSPILPDRRPNNAKYCVIRVSIVSDPPAIDEYVYSVAAASYQSFSIAPYSSRGPVTRDGSNRPKPDITAPGFVDTTIRSTAKLPTNATMRVSY
jgi:hypothetical protein